MTLFVYVTLFILFIYLFMSGIIRDLGNGFFFLYALILFLFVGKHSLI